MNASDFLYLKKRFHESLVTLDEYAEELRTALLEKGDPSIYDELSVHNMTLMELESAIAPYLMLDHEKVDKSDPFDREGELEDGGGHHTGESGTPVGSQSDSRGDGGGAESGSDTEGGDDDHSCDDGADTEDDAGSRGDAGENPADSGGEAGNEDDGKGGTDGKGSVESDSSSREDGEDGVENESKRGSGKQRKKRKENLDSQSGDAESGKSDGRENGKDADKKHAEVSQKGEGDEKDGNGEAGSEKDNEDSEVGNSGNNDDAKSDRDKVKRLLSKKQQSDQDAAEEKKRKTQEALEKMQQNADEHTAMDDVMHMLRTVRCCLLVGPTGTGKSTLAKNACRKLFHVEDAIQSGKYAQISFSPDTTSGEMIGRSDVNGNFHESEVVRVFRDGGLILFDEIDDADASMLIKVNTALANGYLSTPNGMVTRNKDAYIVCAANTFGTGPDAMYVGRSRLDAATLDRFTLATVYVDYDEKLEARIAGALPPNDAKDVIEFVSKVRKAITDGHLRRACSTRFVINAVSHIAAGKDIKWVRENYLLGWKENERSRVEKKPGGSKKEMDAHPCPF